MHHQMCIICKRTAAGVPGWCEARGGGRQSRNSTIILQLHFGLRLHKKILCRSVFALTQFSEKSRIEGFLNVQSRKRRVCFTTDPHHSVCTLSVWCVRVAVRSKTTLCPSRRAEDTLRVCMVVKNASVGTVILWQVLYRNEGACGTEEQNEFHITHTTEKSSNDSAT